MYSPLSFKVKYPRGPVPTSFRPAQKYMPSDDALTFAIVSTEADVVTWLFDVPLLLLIALVGDSQRYFEAAGWPRSSSLQESVTVCPLTAIGSNWNMLAEPGGSNFER